MKAPRVRNPTTATAPTAAPAFAPADNPFCVRDKFVGELEGEEESAVVFPELAVVHVDEGPTATRSCVPDGLACQTVY